MGQEQHRADEQRGKHQRDGYAVLASLHPSHHPLQPVDVDTHAHIAAIKTVERSFKFFRQSSQELQQFRHVPDGAIC